MGRTLTNTEACARILTSIICMPFALLLLAVVIPVNMINDCCYKNDEMI
jgi:hypothetical protein